MKTSKLSKRIFSVTLVLCMLVGTIGVLPMTAFAAESCTCENRCYLNEIDANCTVCTNSDFSGCMGTPELVENGSPWRLSDGAAEVNFMATVNPNVTWKYFYIVTNDATAQPTASEIIAGGASGNYSDPYTLVLDNLAEGEKYIHIVLRQEEQDRTTNVLRLTIPAFEKLTIKPSANGGNYDADTNTLTIEGGGTVNFTLNMPGYVHCENDDTIEATPVGDDPENATEWTATLPATPKTYTFYYGLGGQEAWCTVVVVEDTHYTITPSAEGGNYDASTNTLTIVGGGKVNLTLNVSGSVRFYDNGEFTMTPLNGTADSATEWTTNLPNTNKTYHFYHNLSDLQAECIVIVKKACTLTIDYSATLSDEILVGSGIANKTVVAPQGEVIDLSEYWPDELTYILGENTYYFNEFLENATGGNTVRSVTIFDDLTVYAFWTTKKQITLTFDPNGGSLPYEKVREDYCDISEMNRDRQPTRSGCDFVGWSLENDGTADDGDIQLTEDCTLYAVWKVNSLPTPTNLRWDTSNGTVAVWDAVDGATNYIVKLYKKDIITLHLLSYNVSDTSFEFDLKSLSPGSYYCTVTATFDDIKSESATSNDILTTSGGTAIVIGGENKTIDYIDGTAYIVGREDIANGSITEVDLSGVAGSDSLVIGGKYLAISTETEITRDEARIIVAEWAEIVNTAEGEEQIKNLLTNYSIYELALLQQYTNILILEDSIAQKLYELMRVERDKKKEEAANTKISFENTAAEMDGDALNSILDQLGDGDNVKISVKNAGAEVLPDSLTEKGPYGGSDWTIDKSVFEATGIENIEDRLKTLGLINGNTDSSVTEDEFEYLYHYLTTDELTALKNELNESAHFEHHQNAVNWLTEMIERDGALVTLNTGHLDESGIRSKLEAVGYTGSGLTLGLLRQADLDMEQLQYIKNLMQEFIEAFDDDADELILAWVNEAIAKKEFEATCVQMNALLEEARNTQGSYTGLNDVKAAAKDMTTYELELFLKKANAAKNTESGTIPVLALGAIDSIIKVLNSELEAREASDTPTYVQVGGTNDGINPIFIGAVDVNIGAVKADGTTTPIAIKADRSDAVAWSTTVHVPKLLLDAPEWNTENIRAYKVLDNGTLETRASNVIVNADGTLTLSAMSDGNSTYVFLYEPSTVIPEPQAPNGLSTGAIVIACVVVLAGGGFALYWFVFKKKNI